MSGWRHNLERWLSPHRASEKLVDVEIDGLRGGAAMSNGDRDWLEAHLAECAPCAKRAELRRSAVAALRAGKTERAPEGFAARVLLAARTRNLDEYAVEGATGAQANAEGAAPRGQLAVLATAAALAAGLVVAVVSLGPEGPAKEPHVQVSGAGGSIAPRGEAHFVVRPVGVGAARARAQIVGIIEGASGRIEDRPGRIVGAIPRARLISVVEALSEAGRFKVSRVGEGEIDPAVQTVTIEFVLE